MLCILGATTFSAAAAPRRRWQVAMAIGFLSVALLSGREQLPDPEVAGLFAVGGAVLYLFRPRYASLGFVLGGALAGMFVQLTTVVGVPFLLSAPLIALGMTGIVWFAKTRPAFAPETLREEALLIVCTLGLVVAVMPGVLDGWQAAQNLNVRVKDVATQVIPVWTISVLGISTLLGAAYTLWSRR
jgi:hypothetical protein